MATAFQAGYRGFKSRLPLHLAIECFRSVPDSFLVRGTT